MYNLDTLHTQERCLSEGIKELQDINLSIEKLLQRKEELTCEIIGSLGHEHEGQKTYEYGSLKIEVKTPFVYSLNKKKYQAREIIIPEEFNPIKEYVAYSVDKRLCDKYMIDAPEEVKNALVELIDKKPGKAAVTLKENL